MPLPSLLHACKVSSSPPRTRPTCKVSNLLCDILGALLRQCGQREVLTQLRGADDGRVLNLKGEV